MNRRRSALAFTSAALVAVCSIHAAQVPTQANLTAPQTWTYYAPETSLDEVPVYELAASAPHAMRALESEIDRLYTHAKTLPSGHERRTFQTRIHALEKRLRPLWKEFDASAWETLRSDVRAEWVSVQNGLPSPASAAPVAVSSLSTTSDS